MAFHRLFSNTSTSLLLLPKTFPVASAVKICRSRRQKYTSYTVAPLSQSESDSNEFIDNDLPGYYRSPWMNSRSIKRYFLKVEKDVVKVKADLPGVGKNNVNVWIEKSVMFFEATSGEVKAAAEEEDDYDKPRCYSGAIKFKEGRLKLNQVKAKMNNGVLELVIPKIGFQEERNDDDVKSISDV